MDDFFNILYEMNIKCYHDICHSYEIVRNRYDVRVFFNSTFSFDKKINKKFNLIETLKNCSNITITEMTYCVYRNEIVISFQTEKSIIENIEPEYQLYRRKRNIEKL